jgi:asparagine synthase (glutamine-hydrolysing)
MCGILGSFGASGEPADWLTAGCDALRHRGPDDGGVWRDPAAGIALGHTRLAVIDLSDAGRQPMRSACGRYHLVFNGEIYNHLELRRALGGHAWHGHSDTETLLECVASWGLERALRAAVGMFAFGLFDSAERQLILARDRMGEKPLYYGYARGTFVFGSELAALRAAPGFDDTIDRDALASFIRSSWVPAPQSIYRSMRKLSPGSWVVVTSEIVARRAAPQPVAYWSAIEVALSAQREPLRLSDVDAVAQLSELLGSVVKGQMLADVPLGAFLSGGIDSSTITALMQVHSSARVRTFSIGFDEDGYDESAQARAIAAHLGTDHTELNVRANDALALVPRLPIIYSEPFADSSQLPTFLLAQMTRRHVTVALSGDGGDELFGGYRRYLLGLRTWACLERMPLWARRASARGLRSISPGTWNSLARLTRRLMPRHFRMSMVGDKVHKGAMLLESGNPDELYQHLLHQCWSAQLVLEAEQAEVQGAPIAQSASGLIDRMMLLDTITYLPDDILVKVDRAAMAVSLETRVPLLDHRLFEFAWRLPPGLKIRDGTGKWVLRQLLHRYVPQQLIDRPKRGFAVPLAAWLRGPLRDWAEALLDESRLRTDGYLDAAAVRLGWQQHLSGNRNWQQQVWNVLMFQAWLAQTR